jgi:hypothetical protein
MIMSDLDPHMITGYGFGMVLCEHTSLSDICVIKLHFLFFVNHCSLWIEYFVDNLIKIGFGISTHLVK